MFYLKAVRQGVSTFEQTISDYNKLLEVKLYLQDNGFSVSYEYMRVLPKGE